MTREEFWQMADDTRLTAEYAASEGLSWVETASQRELQRVFLEYRVFTSYYADDLAILVTRTPRGELKSMLAELVYEELGSGDPHESHIDMLERFLLSLGVKDFEQPTDPRNVALLTEMRRQLLDEHPIYAIALRGMGGECVCQVYLMELHRRLRANPYCVASADTIDWQFWDVHAGEPDQAHNQMVKRGIDELLQQDPSSMEHLVAGYVRAKEMLLEFFDNIYDTARSQ